MGAFFFALIIIVSSAFGALARYSDNTRAARIAGFGVAGGCALALMPVLSVLWHGSAIEFYHSWPLPYASLALAIDPLSAFFMLPVLILAPACAAFGMEYLRSDGHERATAPLWFFFNILVAGMLLVLAARNALLFLFAWEIMSVAPYFLVTHDHDRAPVRAAGLTYLVATHIGTAALIGCFLMLGKTSGGNLDFLSFAPGALSGGAFAAVFLFGLIGFGAKAGIIPFHVWLPEAHPAAPSHVSALMSGAMIKMGVYGLVRLLLLLGPARLPLWCAFVLIALGALSGVAGVLLAIGQHDVKRLLAYSSVENIGVVFLGLGAGLLGLQQAAFVVAVLGFAGALLHVLNHALFKGLLFLTAGTVIRATGTGEMDLLGGLIKRMPHTAVFFLLGAVAICGLPPLNGFISEFLLYSGGFQALIALPRSSAVMMILLILTLALIGGLAVACFAKVFGVVFLGQERTFPAVAASDPAGGMRGAMVALAFLCISIGCLPRIPILMLASPIAQLCGDAPFVVQAVAATMPVILGVNTVVVLLLVLSGGVLFFRRRLPGWDAAELPSTGTWDCGYAKPSARMQYTGSSFTDPITRFFCMLVRQRRMLKPIDSLFPAASHLHTVSPDACEDFFYRPLFARVAAAMVRLRWLQPSRVHFFAAYILGALVLLIAWFLVLGE